MMAARAFPRTFRWIAAGLLVALSLWAAVKAAQTGWASYQSVEARALLKRWIEQPATFDQAAWPRVRDSFLTAIEWDPDNPVYHEGFANLHVLSAARVQNDQRQRGPFLNLALKHYLKAAQLRPTWPYTHASIASVKLQLGEIDADFRRAILLASKYGPWESPVHERMILVGYVSWAALGAPEREAVRGNIVRAMQYRPKDTGALMERLKNVLPSCEELAIDVHGACRPAGPAGSITRPKGGA